MSNVEVETTPMPKSNRLEKVTMSVVTAGSIVVGVVGATVTLTTWLSAKPSEDKVEVIAQKAAQAAAAEAVKVAEVADQPRRERNQQAIESLKTMVYEERIHRAETDATLKGVLLMIAEARGPRTLKKVRENIAANVDPVKGVVQGGK